MRDSFRQNLTGDLTVRRAVNRSNRSGLIERVSNGTLRIWLGTRTLRQCGLRWWRRIIIHRAGRSSQPLLMQPKGLSVRLQQTLVLKESLISREGSDSSVEKESALVRNSSPLCNAVQC
jgi:hypothetical protein